MVRRRCLGHGRRKSGRLCASPPGCSSPEPRTARQKPQAQVYSACAAGGAAGSGTYWGHVTLHTRASPAVCTALTTARPPCRLSGCAELRSGVGTGSKDWAGSPDAHSPGPAGCSVLCISVPLAHLQGDRLAAQIRLQNDPPGPEWFAEVLLRNVPRLNVL